MYLGQVQIEALFNIFSYQSLSYSLQIRLIKSGKCLLNILFFFTFKSVGDLIIHIYYSGTLVTINGMTVFKQEAPSPTSNDVTALQVTRQHRQSPTTTHHENIVHNNAMEDNSQNMFNNTINQLLSQTTLENLHNVVDSEYRFFMVV